MIVRHVELGGKTRRLALDLNAQIAIRKRTHEEPFNLVMKIVEMGRPKKNGSNGHDRILEGFEALRMFIVGLLATDCPELERDPDATTTVGGWFGSLEDIGGVSAAILAIANDYANVKPEFEGQYIRLIPTHAEVVKLMISTAHVEGKRVMDLGAGDGRILFAALDAGAVHAIGVEGHKDHAAEIKRKAQARGETGKVTVVQGDVREADLTDIDVLFVYLLPSANAELEEKLWRELKPGSVIVSHDFDMPNHQPAATEILEVEEKEHTVYRWVV